MSRSCCIVLSVLLALAVATTGAAAASALQHEEWQQDKQTIRGDAHLLSAAGTKVAKKDEPSYMESKKPSGAILATQGDGQSSSSGSSSGDHSKEGEGSNSKEGEKHSTKNNCLTKEACHKKKIVCSKGCTLSAHSKCAAKCSKSCVPTC